MRGFENSIHGTLQFVLRYTCLKVWLLLWTSLCSFGVFAVNADSPSEAVKSIGNTALFDPSDFIDVRKFITKLSMPNNDPLSQFLWGTVSQTDQNKLLDASGQINEEAAKILNDILQQGQSIYTNARFAHVVLSPDSSALLNYNSKGSDLIWLNRLLLQDAYPNDLKKKSYAPYYSPCVWHVRSQANLPKDRSPYPCLSQRGEDIWLDIYGLDRWIDELKRSRKVREEASRRTLILYLNHIPLPDVHPFYFFSYPDVNNVGLDCLGFSLVMDDKTKSAWLHLLNQPVLERQMAVTVGFDNGEEMDSYVVADASASDQEFLLTVIPHRTVFGVLVIVAALFVFLWLARYTHIIRDASAPRRPDGIRPYSLARAQMAFWFFLVIAAYFFLWIITGQMDTLNSSVLALIGISAGTALGSAFVDASKPQAVNSPGNVPIVDVTKPQREVMEEMTNLQKETQKALMLLQKARAQIPVSEKPTLDENERQQNQLREQMANYRWQAIYFAWPQWKGVMYDLLAENNLISFHRFQIFVWTLVLGVMFVTNVYSDLAMPQFSSTLLGLLGISAGTYVGFKLPEPKTV